MINFKYNIVALALCGLAMVSCSTSDSDEVFTPRAYNVTGKVEKGPFVSGSTITIQPMDSKLQVLGSMFNTTITDNLGDFTFGSKEFQAPYAEMMATGYFFNEVKGNLSEGTLVLRALVDLSDNSTVNVNILTHLKYPRVKKLIESGKSFKDANTQAQKELLEAFGLQKYVSKDASQFSIVTGTDESAALLAVSSLLLYNRSEGELTEYLSTLSQEFGNNGAFSETTKAKFKKDREQLASKLNDVQTNVIRRYSDLGMNIEVKNLMAYFDWDDDGIAGNESLKEGQSVTLEKTEISVPKEGGTYTIEINSPIPVYTEPIVGGLPADVVVGESVNLYDGDRDLTPEVEKNIANNVLTIIVGKTTSRYEQSIPVELYDGIGNNVATVNVKIEGDKQGNIPLLSSEGQGIVINIASYIAAAYGQYNLIEQLYFYNKKTNQLPLNNGSDSYVSKCWTNMFAANRRLLTIKRVDENQRGVYQEYCDVLYAMYYYSLIVGWGDVPYNYGKLWDDPFGGPRVSTSTIFDDLKKKLSSAIEYLEEKKNTSTADANGFFFMSKDVARIILANIHMYECNWQSAETLLAKVRSNGFYQLDATDENERTNNGVIFGLLGSSSSPRSVTIKQPSFIPIQSLVDVYLSSAECEYHLGNEALAKSLLAKVTSVKGISVSSNVLTGIKEARAKCLLYDTNYFAFLKRNNLAVSECGIKDYQELFPIPMNEMMGNPYITQNPGY